jgi:TonB family protein
MALGVLVQAAASAQTTGPACAVPNQPPRLLEAARPVTPPIAAAQKIYGEVIVQISLDEQSRLVSASISRSPSALLNNAALQATIASKFQTRIVDCQPVADRYRFVVLFNPPPATPQPSSSQ